MAVPGDLEDVVVEVHKLGAAATDAKSARVTGTVTAGGAAVTDGWVELWYPRTENDTWNVSLLRQCPVPERAWPWHTVGIQADGRFTLENVWPGRPYLIVQVPGQPLQVRPLTLRAGRHEAVELAITAGGAIEGRVTDVAESLRGRLWVVVFDRHIVRRSVRVGIDGSFAFRDLPPGEYGLRVGGEGMRAAREVWPEVFKAGLFSDRCRPWAGVAIERVRAGETLAGVVVPCRQ